MPKKASKKANVSAKVEATAKAIYQRKRTTTEVIPPDVTRARTAAWLDLISPLTEWIGLKGDEIRYRREQLRIQREDVLHTIIRKAKEQLQSVDKVTPLPNKFLMPFLEKASLEDQNGEPTTLWSQLLVSAASKYDPVHLRIIEILSQMGPNEARYLKQLLHGSRSKKALTFAEDTPYFFSSLWLRSDAQRCFDSHRGAPDKLVDRLVREIELPGGILNYVLLVGLVRRRKRNTSGIVSIQSMSQKTTQFQVH